MSQRMAEVGADAVMVITPYYFKNAMTNEALEQHFTKVHASLDISLVSTFKVVLQGSPRFPDIHDLSQYHRLYDLGSHTEQPYMFLH